MRIAELFNHHPHRRAFRGLLLPSLMALAGCTHPLEGPWRCDAPTENKALDFHWLDFKPDGGFVAQPVIEKHITLISGKWTYRWGRLTLESGAADKREYWVMTWFGNALDLSTTIDGKTLQQSFHRPPQAIDP